MIRIIPVKANVIIVVHTYYTYTASFDVLIHVVVICMCVQLVVMCVQVVD